MKGDLHPIAFALSQRLPVRTHHQPEPPPRPSGYNPEASGLRRPIRVAGVEYESITKAREKLRCGMRSIYKWLQNGKATYI